MINPSWRRFLSRKRFEVVFESKKWGFVMTIESGRRKINQPRLCAGTGKSTLVSKICNFHDSASLVVDCKSLTLGWIFLSLHKVVVDSYSLTLGWDTIGWDNISPDVLSLGIDLSPVGENKISDIFYSGSLLHDVMSVLFVKLHHRYISLSS